MRKVIIIGYPERGPVTSSSGIFYPESHAKIEIIKYIRAQHYDRKHLSLVKAKEICDSVPCSFNMTETKCFAFTQLLTELKCKWDVVPVEEQIVDGKSISHYDLELEVLKEEISYLHKRMLEHIDETRREFKELTRMIFNKEQDEPSMHGCTDG